MAHSCTTDNKARGANLPTDFTRVRGRVVKMSGRSLGKSESHRRLGTARPPVRQRHASVEVIADMSSTIEFDEVAEKHCSPLKDIIAQTYDLQIATSKAVRYRSLSPDALDDIKRSIRLAGQANAHARNAFAEMKREEI